MLCYIQTRQRNNVLRKGDFSGTRGYFEKELLDATGISYGQLYRWKRKNIIPEEWFIKKSSFTGQETFFPKEKMLERVEAIKGMKDEYSLDELSAFFPRSLRK